MANENIIISDEHKPHLARLQHVLEWLQAERARVDAELTHIVQQGARTQAQLVALLQQFYGVDAQHTPFTLDTERGVITVPHVEPDTNEPTATDQTEEPSS